MNRYPWLTLTALGVLLAWHVPAAADTLASSLGIFIYPTQNQSAQQQSEDDSACYQWAKGQTGYDPINPTQVVAATPDKGPSGARVAGAAGGAATGALVGAIAGDAGKGAAIGATLGVLGGGRREREAKAYQAQEAQQAAAQQTQAMQDGFKKAYAACIQARGYTATY